MQLVIESPGLPTDDNLEILIRSKFDDLEKIYGRMTSALVVLRKENDDRKKYFHIEARLSVPQKTLFAKEQAETFEKALHKMMDDLTHQLHRFKDEREEVR